MILFLVYRADIVSTQETWNEQAHAEPNLGGFAPL